MRPMSVARRVREAAAKLAALVEISASSRLEEHALREAVLHQLAATWLALVRQVGDAHGIKPLSVDGLDQLNERLAQRGLPSREADELSRAVASDDSWLAAFFAHYQEACCPPEPMTTAVNDLIPSTDRRRLDAIREARYRPWVDAMVALIERFQERFHES